MTDHMAHFVHVFQPDGTLVWSWGSEGSGLGQFRHPCGIAVSALGEVLVGDSTNLRIQVFGEDGTFRRQFPDLSKRPLYLALAPNDVFVVTADSHCVLQ